MSQMNDLFAQMKCNLFLLVETAPKTDTYATIRKSWDMNNLDRYKTLAAEYEAKGIGAAVQIGKELVFKNALVIE